MFLKFKEHEEITGSRHGKKSPHAGGRTEVPDYKLAPGPKAVHAEGAVADMVQREVLRSINGAEYQAPDYHAMSSSSPGLTGSSHANSDNHPGILEARSWHSCARV